MMAFGKLREKERNESKTSKMCFTRTSNSPRDEGQLIGHKVAKKGIDFEVPLLLCVDDTALVHSSRKDLETGCNV